MAGRGPNSCTTPIETLEWISSIVRFVKSYNYLINAHVTDFFTERLWESIDEDWMSCLRQESVHNLSLIPSGVVQEHWPATLKEFAQTLKTLSFPRDQADLKQVFPGLTVITLTTVLAQGMNAKKRHEVQILSAVVSAVATSVGAQNIVDVGSGQGYLAQVLSFLYRHSVVAVDSSAHHGKISEARAERIKKHYNSQMRKSGSEHEMLHLPKIVTCHITSVDALKAVTDSTLHFGTLQQYDTNVQGAVAVPSMILAGLHSCGDLSVTMLKTFSRWKEVKAVVSIGCCYNLLTEAHDDLASDSCGFPMSEAVKSAGLMLGKGTRDLACQSAERWNEMQEDDCLQNFSLHAFRAAFQVVLHRYFPETKTANPSIGRQGKALRRKQQRRNMKTSPKGFDKAETLPQQISKWNGIHSSLLCAVNKTDGETPSSINLEWPSTCNCSQFKAFSLSALSRLNLEPSREIDFHGIWKEVEPFADYIGPYWSLRSAFGPVIETLILLDRLLFLQEQGTFHEAHIVPIFDPAVSPRNLAIIAKRSN